MIRWKHIYAVFGFPTGTQEPNVRILNSDTIVPIPLKSYMCTYLQPVYPLGTKKKFSGLASGKLAKVYEGKYLLYATPENTLAMYELDMIDKCAKGGDFDDEIIIEIGASVQSIDFFTKTFENNRICVLTSEGQILKIVVSGKTASAKRIAQIPDQIDQDIIFTAMAISSDTVIATGFNLADHSCLFVVMGRNLEVVARTKLEYQGKLS